MEIEFHEMTIADYDEVVALWGSVEGVGLDDDADSRPGIASYLARNPGSSFVARHDGKIVGAVLCGHEGRRGYLHHLAVSPAYRGRGIGRALVDRCLAALASAGIARCNIVVFAGNAEGLAFWNRTGWVERPDLKIMQKPTPHGA